MVIYIYLPGGISILQVYEPFVFKKGNRYRGLLTYLQLYISINRKIVKLTSM